MACSWSIPWSRSRSFLGYPLDSIYGVPSPRHDWCAPKTELGYFLIWQREGLGMCCRQYASCGYTGGLSCFIFCLLICGKWEAKTFAFRILKMQISSEMVIKYLFIYETRNNKEVENRLCKSSYCLLWRNVCNVMVLYMEETFTYLVDWGKK